MIFWQNACVDMLKDKCLIIPDDHLREFKIDDGFFIPYRKGYGLKPLSQSQINDRDSQLRRNVRRSKNTKDIPSKDIEFFNIKPEDKLFFKRDSNAYAIVDSVTPSEIVIRISTGRKYHIPKNNIPEVFLGFS